MNKQDAKLLKDNGFEVDCESPFEISHEDGDTATGYCAMLVLDALRFLNGEEVDG